MVPGIGTRLSCRDDGPTIFCVVYLDRRLVPVGLCGRRRFVHLRRRSFFFWSPGHLRLRHNFVPADVMARMAASTRDG
jgi:hypothetical protein